MSGTTILLLVVAAVAGVFGIAFPPLCIGAVIVGILGALSANSDGKRKRAAEEAARTAAIVDAINRQQKPPQ